MASRLACPCGAGGHPAAHGARRALVLVTAAGVVLGGGGAGVATALSRPAEPVGPMGPFTPADVDAGPGPSAGTGTGTGTGTEMDTAVLRERSAAGAADHVSPWPGPDTPQGGREPLHGAPGPNPQPSPTPTPPPGTGTGTATTPATSQISTGTLRQTTRAEIINRAKLWVTAQVPYSMEKYWSDGYRQDCSGYISMAWNLRSNEWTGSLDRFAERIDRTELQPGDILLFHNPANPTRGSHVTIFGGWTDYTHTSYIAYEQTKPRTRKQATPMAYWENSGRYVAYRYKGVVSGGSGGGTTGGGSKPTTPTTPADPVPGRGQVRPGREQLPRHPARQAPRRARRQEVLQQGTGSEVGRGGPACDPGVPARAGLEGQGSGRPARAGHVEAPRHAARVRTSADRVVRAVRARMRRGSPGVATSVRANPTHMWRSWANNW